MLFVVMSFTLLAILTVCAFVAVRLNSASLQANKSCGGFYTPVYFSKNKTLYHKP